MVNVAIWIPDCDSHSPVLLDLFLLMLVFVLQSVFLHWEVLIMLLSQLPLTFHYIHNRMHHFITQLVLIGTVFVIIWEMFHGRIYLNLALGTFGKLSIVLSTLENLLYIPPLFNSPQCSLLHLIKQNCLMKTFQRTLIFMTQVSL